MTALAQRSSALAPQTTARPRKRPTPSRPPSRSSGRPVQLPRPGPAATWDPLAIDAEAHPSRDDHGIPAPAPLPPPPAEDLSRVGAVISKAVVEVLTGLRPAAQAQRWLLDDVWQTLRRRAALSRRNGTADPRPVKVLRVHPCPIDARACELAVVLYDGHRVRAAAVRLTLHQGRWRAAAIRVA